MTDIFQEVEEDVRRERYEQLWENYGHYVMGAAALLILGVAGYEVWLNYDANQRQAYSAKYEAAEKLAEANNIPAAETNFTTLSKTAPTGYATLAKFHLAGQYLAEGKRDAAIAQLRELTTLSDAVLANAAKLRLAWTLADTSSKADIATLVQPLTAAGSPWRFAAGEILAYMDLKEGARDQAAADYAKLAADKDTPADLRQRAIGISQYLKANPASGSNPVPQGIKP